MTVIAWDGITLAADKQATNAGLPRTVTKIHKVDGRLVAVSGDFSKGVALIEWVKRGAIIDEYPSFQITDNWCSLLIIGKNGEILKYEQQPYPIVFEDKHYAMGSGRDYAMAAMYIGKTAKEAAEVACALDSDCGCGVDILRLDE